MIMMSIIKLYVVPLSSRKRPLPGRLAPMSDDWRTLRVSTAALVAEGVLELRLVDPEGGPVPPWDPGAHLDVETPGGIRQYSLCGHAEDDFYTIAILRENEGRGGSRSLHESMSPGCELRV